MNSTDYETHCCLALCFYFEGIYLKSIRILTVFRLTWRAKLSMSTLSSLPRLLPSILQVLQDQHNKSPGCFGEKEVMIRSRHFSMCRLDEGCKVEFVLGTYTKCNRPLKQGRAQTFWGAVAPTWRKKSTFTDKYFYWSTGPPALSELELLGRRALSLRRCERYLIHNTMHRYSKV